jgi:hypothetical protein
MRVTGSQRIVCNVLVRLRRGHPAKATSIVFFVAMARELELEGFGAFMSALGLTAVASLHKLGGARVVLPAAVCSIGTPTWMSCRRGCAPEAGAVAFRDGRRRRSRGGADLHA